MECMQESGEKMLALLYESTCIEKYGSKYLSHSISDSATNGPKAEPDVKRLQVFKDLLPLIQKAKDTAISQRLWFIARAVCTFILVMFLSFVSSSDAGYLLTAVCRVANILLVLVAAFFVCTGVIVKATEKNIFVGVEKEIKLRIQRLQAQK